MSTELVERLREAEALNNKYAWERDKAREERDAAERRSEAHWRPRLEAAQAANTALTEALRPFGKLGDIPEHFDDAVTVQAGIDYTMDAEEVESLQKLSGGALTSDRATLIVSIDSLTAGDFRRARALSEPDKE